jgi:hypothetical protein
MVRSPTWPGGRLGAAAATAAAALLVLGGCGPSGTRAGAVEDAWGDLQPDDWGDVIYETRYGSGGMSSDPPTHEAVFATTGSPSAALDDAAGAVTAAGYALVGAACTPGATCRFEQRGDAGLVTVRLSVVAPHTSTEVHGQRVTVGDDGPALWLAVLAGR